MQIWMKLIYDVYNRHIHSVYVLNDISIEWMNEWKLYLLYESPLILNHCRKSNIEVGCPEIIFQTKSLLVCLTCMRVMKFQFETRVTIALNFEDR